MKKLITIALASLVVAALLAGVLPAIPVAAKVGSLSLLDVRFNPDKGLVVVFAVKDGVLGPHNLHATMTIADKTYDLSCVYKREIAMVVCMATNKLSGGEQAIINIDGLTFLITVPNVVPERNITLPAACPPGQVPGYTATITGTFGDAPRTASQTVSESEIGSYGGLSEWHDMLVDLYTVEMEWSGVSVTIEAGCINP